MEIINGINFFNCPKTYIKLDGTESIEDMLKTQADLVVCPNFKKADKVYIEAALQIVGRDTRKMYYYE